MEPVSIITPIRTVLKNTERHIILNLPKDDLIILIFNNHDPFTITVSAK
jgi:hypothetical protein